MTIHVVFHDGLGDVFHDGRMRKFGEVVGHSRIVISEAVTRCVPVVVLEILDHILGRIRDKCDGDEIGEDFLRRPRRELHQHGHVEERIQGEEERVPQSDHCVKGQKVDFKILGDGVDGLDEQG